MKSSVYVLGVLLAVSACDEDDASAPVGDGGPVDAHITGPADAAATPVDAAPPAFLFWTEPGSLRLVPGTCVAIKAKVQRLRYDGQILIGFGGSAQHVGASTDHIAAGTSEADVNIITKPDAPPAVGEHLTLSATTDQFRERQLVEIPVEVLPQPAGDAGAPDGGWNQSSLPDYVCRSFLYPPPPSN